MKTNIVLTTSFGMILILPSLSQVKIKATDFDTNGSKMIEPNELRANMLHQESAQRAALDTNRDGFISVAESRTVREKVNRAAPQSVRDSISLYTARAESLGADLSRPMTPYLVDKILEQNQPKGINSQSSFRLRASTSDFSIPIPEDGPVDALNPAIISYGRNLSTGDDSFTAKGAIGFYWDKSDKKLEYGIGVDFEHLDTQEPGVDDVETLAFKIIGSRHWDPQGQVDDVILRGELNYATNFDFDGGLFGGAIELEPLWPYPAFTGVATFGSGEATSSPAYVLRNYFRIEGGDVVSDFAPAKGISGSYLRGGGYLEAHFWPMGTQGRVSLDLSYGYMAGITTQTEDFANFKAGMNVRLDESGRYSLRVEYIDGETPLLLQERESLLVSLALRF